MKAVTILSVLAILAGLTLNATAADSSSGRAKTALRSPGKTLLFFMNPYGAPCQIQDNILRGMAPDLQPKARLQYVKTTVPADREMFEKYGVRGLPFLVVVDKNGQERHRFTAGIHTKQAILAGLAR